MSTRCCSRSHRGERTRSWGITAPIDTQLYDASIEGSYGNDPKLANALLDEAGWTGRDAEGFRTKDGQRLRIEATQAQATLRDQRDVLLQALQAQLRQKAGIDLTIAYVDPGTYADRTASGKFDAILNSTTPAGDGFNIEYHYLPVDQGGRIDYSRTAAPEVLAWLQAAAATLDRKTRFDLYARLQRFAIVEQGYGLPLYVPEDQIAAASHVHGEDSAHSTRCRRTPTASGSTASPGPAPTPAPDRQSKEIVILVVSKHLRRLAVAAAFGVSVLASAPGAFLRPRTRPSPAAR